MFTKLVNIFYVFCTFYCICKCLPSSEEKKGSSMLPNLSEVDAKQSDVKYRLFRTESFGEIHDVESIKDAKIYPNTTTKYLIHGWLSNETTYWYPLLKNEYFKSDSHPHVIYVDYSLAGNTSYTVACANSKLIGEYVADFIIASGVNFDRIHLLGHSLGAQVAGYVGKHILEKTKKKLGRITGLDPAGPIFDNLPTTKKLDKNDANFVDVVHTDDGHYGHQLPLGHVDFYPNGGSQQPGCPSLFVDDNCSHARCNFFYSESVNSKTFYAYKADSWKQYLEGNYTNKDKIIFGENAPTNKRGKFYFKTNSFPPYLL